MFPVILEMDLRIKNFHNPDYGPGLLRTLGPVLYILQSLHHLKHVPAILRHGKFFPFCIVIQHNRILFVVIVHLNFLLIQPSGTLALTRGFLPLP